MGVLENYVMLENGIPTRLHFIDHMITSRVIYDPITNQPATRKVLVFDVDEMDSRKVVAKYSTMSEKHANQFAAYLPDKKYVNYDFTIVRTGEGFLTRYSVTAVPRT